MSQVIPISQSNATPQTNIFRYQLPNGSFTLRDNKVSLANLIIPYQWSNISTFYLNSTGISMIFPTGATTQTITLTIPNGFYTIAQLNSYLQSQMIANNFYLVNGSTNVYYLEIVPNVNTGLAQLNCYPIPTTTSYTNPGWTLPTTADQVPQLVITNQNFGDLIGFTTGTYPTSPTHATTYSVQSSKTPQISPVSSIYVCVSIVNNIMSTPNNIIAVVPINATYGGQITYNAPQLLWVKCLDGVISSITLTFYDQFMRQLPMEDTNITANLLIT